MARRKNSNKTKKSPSKKSAATSNRVKPINWLKWGRRGLITLVLAGITTFSVAAYMDKLALEQDLSVIGNGTATVVQIHDPGCQLCQQLKRNVDRVKGDFEDTVQFKIANIKNQKGSEFASKHRVNHVTLLFFDKRGRRINVINGVTPSAEIRQALEQLASR
ncbi:MAG: thioredoxin fold domain-containing protein [Cellvibrionaceae bacterium]